MSNDLVFQLFIGLPKDEIDFLEDDAEKYGLEIVEAGINLSGEATDVEKKFVGLSVGESVSWEGEWAQSIGLGEFMELKKKVVEGFREAGIHKKPRLFWLANFY